MTADVGSTPGRQDEVDLIVRAWSEVLPTLDVEPMHVFSRLHRLAGRIQDLRRDAFSEHGLAVWQFDVLAALRRAGAPYELTPGRLVTETRVSSGTMTNRIDRLAERGLVARRGSSGDRRIVLVRLTEAGTAAVDGAVADLVARERALLETLPDGGAADLAALLRGVLTQYTDTAQETA
ncbi:MarR family transcriptional regulator [Serinibacter arcticus]|uniref:MarR family transcriptional regulator n=1 Tax=Serinibacter arcticus TaxID=1655435 RepID=A0A2U1ZYA5_9MICO|nr:MarR family transcriptional regulator [Serinibacter arcticus]PWD51975.1 MarR family transcriptional regulator [Serinibacter arcticus]